MRDVNNPVDARSFLYKPTLKLLSFLGVSTRDELPEFEETQAILAGLIMGSSAVDPELVDGDSLSQTADEQNGKIH